MRYSRNLFHSVVVLALAFGLCAAIAMAINPLAFSKFFYGPTTMPTAMGRSRSYYWDIALYAELALKNTCSAFYPLWAWLIRAVFQPQDVIQAGRGFLILATGLFFASLPLVVAVFQTSLGKLGRGMALLYVLSPSAIFRVNGYSEGLFGVLSLLLLWALLPRELPRELPHKSPQARLGLGRWLVLGLAAGAMALARPAMVPMVAAALATLLTLYLFTYIQSGIQLSNPAISPFQPQPEIQSKTQSEAPSRRPFLPPEFSPPHWRVVWRHCQLEQPQALAKTLCLIISAGLGYSIYGGLCVITRGDFFAPFHDQSLWKKALGFRPELLLLPKSPLIDLQALYLPGLLLLVGLLIAYGQITKKSWAGFVPRSPLEITLGFILCFYPPLAILSYFGKNYLARQPLWQDAAPTNSMPSLISDALMPDELITDNPQTDNLTTNYLFWFSSYFALSHAAIAFFTQDRLVSLGRYVFALPFIFIALGYVLRRFPDRLTLSLLYGLSGISALYLIQQWVDYGNHQWLG